MSPPWRRSSAMPCAPASSSSPAPSCRRSLSSRTRPSRSSFIRSAPYPLHLPGERLLGVPAIVWFETRRFATLLTMRDRYVRPHPEEPPKAASRRIEVVHELIAIHRDQGGALRRALTTRFSGVLPTLYFPQLLHLHQRHLGDGAAAARRCAFGAGGLRTPRRAGPALGFGWDLLRLRRDRAIEELEAELVASSLVRDDDDADVSAALELAEQNLVGEALLDMLLDDPRHRPRAHLLVVAVVHEPFGGFFGELDGDVAVAELRLELQHELLDDLGDHLRAEMREGDDRVEPVAELGREHAVDRLQVVPFPLGPGEAVGGPCHVGGARIGGHDQDDVAEVDLLAVVVGELAVIHDL